MTNCAKYERKRKKIAANKILYDLDHQEYYSKSYYCFFDVVISLYVMCIMILALRWPLGKKDCSSKY